jgi:hypothetical protein
LDKESFSTFDIPNTKDFFFYIPSYFCLKTFGQLPKNLHQSLNGKGVLAEVLLILQGMKIFYLHHHI